MKEKLYHFYGKAIDKNGLPHIVTIVGKFTEKKETKKVIEDVDINTEDGKEYNGTVIYEKPKKVRRLVYSFSICHPDDCDNFSEDVGINIAKKRLNKYPLGKLETNMSSTLAKDQIKWVLFGELNYIIENIDKFINKD